MAKSSLGSDEKVYLPEQILEDVFSESHAQIWIDIKKQVLIMKVYLTMKNKYLVLEYNIKTIIKTILHRNNFFLNSNIFGNKEFYIVNLIIALVFIF